MENSLSNAVFPNFGKNLSFIMDHDSGYMSSESTARPDEEKFVIAEVIPNAGNNTEDAVDGESDLKNWEVVTTSFINVVTRDDSAIIVNSADQQHSSGIIPTVSLTPKKCYENSINPNVSPDLFEDEEFHTEEILESKSSMSQCDVDKYIVKKDYSLLRRVTNSLKGVIPPYFMTVLNLTIDEILNKIETNRDYFWDCESVLEKKNEQVLNTSNNSSDDGFTSLLITGDKDLIDKKWPNILMGRFHGLHHNRSHISEEFEDLCTKYAQRYVGDETQSSCTVFNNAKTSPSKRKPIKQRWSVKSPGRRLSHLARRRITFSSANLQSNSSALGTRARQILVDAKKLDLLRKRSPKHSPRKTPNKSPKKKSRTPSSSAKKKLAARFRKLTGEIQTTSTSPASKSILLSKRALFQSPDRDNKSNIFLPSTSGIFSFDSENKPAKRALFLSPSKSSLMKKSPFKRSPMKAIEILGERKRKRSESDDRPSKFPRSLSVEIHPSDSELKKFKSSTANDSFCSQSLNQSSGELSAVHKKKLQWAVYEALRSQNISPTHNQFKVFASNLARITRKLLPLNAPGKEVGTTERMLRITLYHVHAVIKGRSVDDIVQEYLKSKAKFTKPHGYIGIDDIAINNSYNRKPSFNVLQDKANVLESLEKKKLLDSSKLKIGNNIQVERIRKAIDFGDDDNR